MKDKRKSKAHGYFVSSGKNPTGGVVKIDGFWGFFDFMTYSQCLEYIGNSKRSIYEVIVVKVKVPKIHATPNSNPRYYVVGNDH